MKSLQNNTIISTEDLSENDSYVLVRFTEIVRNKVIQSVEKGIKDSSGDIIKFVKC